MEKNKSVLVIGDLAVDYFLDLGDIDFDNTYLSRPLYEPHVSTSIGGKGYTFAKAFSKTSFASVNFLAMVGANEDKVDLMGEIALKEMKDLGISPIIQMIPYKETGKVFMIKNRGVRIIVLADRGANTEIKLSDKAYLTNNIDLLYVSGYSLFDKIQEEEIGNFIKISKNKKIKIAGEAVPHDIYQKFNYQSFLEKTRNIDFIEVSFHTMQGFLGHNVDILNIIKILLKDFSFCFMYINFEGTVNHFIVSDGKTTIEFDIITNNPAGIADLVNAEMMYLKLNDKFTFSEIKEMENKLIYNLKLIKF